MGAKGRATLALILLWCGAAGAIPADSSKVVLPLPEGPTMAQVALWATAKLTLRSTVRGWPPLR